MPQWETYRGDEWRYRDDAIEAAAAINPALTPQALVVTVVSRTADSLSAARLLHLLRLTRRQLPEFELWCSLDAQTEPLLDQLARAGQLRWEPIHHPHSRDARILELMGGQGPE